MPNIVHLFTVNAPLREVFRAITEQKGLSSWWTETAIASPEPGAELEFTFGDIFYNKMKVISFHPDKGVEWECLEGAEEWVGTRLSFRLKKVEDGCEVRFEHRDWLAETDFYASCSFNWAYYLQSLRLYLETGRGTPYSSK
ncbi:SRPBCC domain-containing protein [bacterium]|nr:SRPBCC domain-containing protein [bacterium]